MVLTANHVGQYSRELLTANRTTGLSVEYLQTLQRQARATGRELDFQGLGEVAIRFGEAVAEGTGPATEALARLGFDARTVAITDIPAVIAAIQQLETDAARRFEFDEIFGGSEGETLADIANLPPETLNRISQLNALSAEAAQRFADQKDRLDALNISFQHSTANVAGGFLPVMEDVSDNLLPIIEGFGDWAAENEHVVRGLLAGAVATTALVGAIYAITKATTLLNAALAVRAALSGPAGWAALGVAAAVGVGAYAISGGFGDQADEAEGETSRLADAQQETADLLGRSTGPGSAPQPVRDRDLISEYGDDKDRLENILAGLDCEISRLKEGPEGTPAQVNAAAAKAAFDAATPADAPPLVWRPDPIPGFGLGRDPIIATDGGQDPTQERRATSLGAIGLDPGTAARSAVGRAHRPVAERGQSAGGRRPGHRAARPLRTATTVHSGDGGRLSPGAH